MARKRPLRKQINDLLDKYNPIIKAAFLESIQDVRSNVVLRVFADRLKRGDIDGAIDALNLERAAFASLEAAIAQAYASGGASMVGNMPTLRDAAGDKVVVRFDVRNPRAEQWLADHSSNLITRIIDDQRNSIRAVLVEGMSQGRNPNNVALDIVGRISRANGQRMGGIVGLSGTQIEHVEAARQELLSGDKNALRNYLERVRRDRRFDSLVRKAIKEGKPLDRATVDRIIGRYSDRLLALRGETIARTEGLASINASRKEGFRQGLEKTNYGPDQVIRTWDSAGDSRVRHSHDLMDGQTVQGLEEPYTTPDGARMMHPGDTSLGAPAKEIINCRCIERIEIDVFGDRS